MSVSAIRQSIWGTPRLFSGKSSAESDHAWGRLISRRFRLLLKLGVGLLIVVWLPGVVWIVPVS